jgi:hypothetical protein
MSRVVGGANLGETYHTDLLIKVLLSPGSSRGMCMVSALTQQSPRGAVEAGPHLGGMLSAARAEGVGLTMQP